MTAPIILPASKPLPHAHRIEFGAWVAAKLHEARALGPDGAPPMFVVSLAGPTDADRRKIEKALEHANPGLLTCVPLTTIEADRGPWPFSLLQLKANLRP